MPRTGHFILHTNVMPRVTAGKYALRSTQTGLPFDVDEEVTHVHVSAPRYVMPTDQILSSFPPANAEGAFGDRLPQIVLKRRTLPWERNPAGGHDPSPTPWLALVVVAEGEAELSTATPVGQCVTAGVPLFDADDRDVEQGVYLAVTETVVKKIFPRKDDLPLLSHVREVDVHDTELANGDDDGWLAVVLANRLPVFDQASGKSVRYLACLVNLEGQLDVLPKNTPPREHFAFELAQDWTRLVAATADLVPDQRVLGAVATLANAPHDAPRDGARAATGATKNGPGAGLDGAASITRAAVSKQWAAAATAEVAKAALDPDAKRMVRDTMGLGFRLPIELVAAKLEKVYRFPVLAHWSFTTNEGATFETLMQDLDVGLLGTVAEPAANAPMAKAGPETVQTGHIGLGHRTRRGDQAQAWYRGPCVPFPTPRDSTAGNAPLALAHSADQLRRVVPDGREDLGLAAAFEIGRLLALSQLSVVSALLRFRGEQFGAGRVRELFAQLLAIELPAPSRDLGRYVALQALGAIARDPARVIGPRRPVADPGRPLNVRGDLDAVVAAGLGLDLAALRKQAERIGTLAALQQAAAPLALEPGATPDDKLVMPVLQAALRDELHRTLDVAVPKRLATPAASRRGARTAARPQADALDELLARLAAEAEDTP